MSSISISRQRGMLVKIVFFLIMLAVVLLCLFSSRFSHVIECESIFKPETALSNIWCGLIGVAFVAIIGMAFFKLRTSLNSGKYTFLIVSALICVLQMFFVWNYYFETNWDVGTLTDAARDAVAGNDINVHEHYFSENPNNLLLLRIFIWVFTLAHWLGMGQSDVFLLLVVQCLLVWLSGAMLFQLLCKMRDCRTAWVGYLLFFSLVIVSPWVSIPYSDTMALVFPLAMLWLAFTSVCRKRSVRLFLLCLVAVVGYKIKPQTVLVFISLIMVYGLRLIRLRKRVLRRPCRKELRNGAIAVVAGLLIGAVLCATAIKSIGMHTRSESAFVFPHYLMMGMNTQTIGSYTPDDVALSRACPNRKERAKANFSETGHRWQKMGVGGFFQHIGEKTIVNYFDGTFGWGWEGNFYKKMLQPKNATISPVARDLYYTTWPRGKYYHVWANFAQIMWMGVLMLSLLAAFGKTGRRERTVMLALVFLTLFEALFEARTRHLFCFVPLYILTALQGLHFLGGFFKRKPKDNLLQE